MPFVTRSFTIRKVKRKKTREKEKTSQKKTDGLFVSFRIQKTFLSLLLVLFSFVHPYNVVSIANVFSLVININIPFDLVLLLHISSINSTPIISKTIDHISEENDPEYHNTYSALIYLMRKILAQRNLYEQTMLLNQLREYLNRLCIMGLFGSPRAYACRRVMDVIRQTSMYSHVDDDDDGDDENDETFNETRGIQKRFFCNGFTGCKSISG